MIPFFRKIRYRLVNDNQPSSPAGRFFKYFRYAIGEILLVVIGILIALYINNWNEQRRDDKLEAVYYCRLLEDLIQDGELIIALIQLTETRLKASNQAVRLLQKDQANKIEVAHEIALAINSIYADFQPNNSAFVDIKSGANLNVIKDKNVIKALNTYFNNLESIKSVIKINGENVVEIYYAHDDSFEDGKTPSSVLYGRFKEGMEPDVREAFEIDTVATLSESMGYRMYNEALRYTLANTRQLELYNVMKDFNAAITTILNRKCPENED